MTLTEGSKGFRRLVRSPVHGVGGWINTTDLLFEHDRHFHSSECWKMIGGEAEEIPLTFLSYFD